MKTDKMIFLLGLALLLLPLALAEAVPIDLNQVDLTTALLTVSQDWKGQEIPGPLGTLFGNQNVNIYLTLGDGQQKVLHLVTENKVLNTLEEGELTAPTLKVFVTEASLQEILSSKQPQKALKTALKEKKITYEALGWKNKLKFSVLVLISKFVPDPQEEEGKSIIEKVQVAQAEKIKEKVVEESKSSGEETEASSPAPLTGAAAVEEEKALEDSTPKITSHVVELTNLGFEPATLEIKVGDKVIWQDVRDAKIDTGMVLGTQKCSRIKSKILHPGETYSWTFTEPGTCLIADGIYTLSSSKVIVSK